MGELFENDDITVLISLPEFSSNTNFKMTDDCYVFKFLRRGVNGKHLMRFQSETSGFKFRRRSVDAVLFLRWKYEWELAKSVRAINLIEWWWVSWGGQGFNREKYRHSRSLHSRKYGLNTCWLTQLWEPKVRCLTGMKFYEFNKACVYNEPV